jgi:hypothetical protein
MEKSNQKISVSMKPVVMTVVYLLGLSMLHKWLPEPYAAALLVLIIGLVYYWIPPRPHMGYLKWAIRIGQWATIVFIVMTIYTVISNHLSSFSK